MRLKQIKYFIYRHSNVLLIKILDLFGLVNYNEAIYSAMTANKVRVVRYLLSLDYVTKGLNYNKLIRGAARSGSIELVQLIVSEANKHNYNIKFGLYCACVGSSRQVVDLFLQMGAKNYKDGFYGAIKSGNKELILLMISLISPAKSE